MARSLNVSVDGISDLLSSVKDNTPQLYEQLVREWTYYTVLGKVSGAMVILTGILVAYTVILRFSLLVDTNSFSYRDVPDKYTSYQYAKIITRENVNGASKTFRWLFIGITVTTILSLVFNISKNFLAPNYSFLINEILPRLTNK